MRVSYSPFFKYGPYHPRSWWVLVQDCLADLTSFFLCQKFWFTIIISFLADWKLQLILLQTLIFYFFCQIIAGKKGVSCYYVLQFSVRQKWDLIFNKNFGKKKKLVTGPSLGICIEGFENFYNLWNCEKWGKIPKSSKKLRGSKSVFSKLRGSTEPLDPPLTTALLL